MEKTKERFEEKVLVEGKNASTLKREKERMIIPGSYHSIPLFLQRYIMVQEEVKVYVFIECTIKGLFEVCLYY